jgi:GMP synthase (glutamine-hydrolysing)
LLPCTANLDTDVSFKPKGIILSGGPSSVYDKDAPHVDSNLWNLNIPILGICYGLQVLNFKLL